MPYYNDDQVRQSREVLDELLGHAPNAILIGGWGTWIRLHSEMSHDIDLIITHSDLAVLQPIMDVGIDKNLRLGGKRTADYHDVHVDLYVDHEASLGQELRLATKHLGKHAETVDNYRVLTPEAHIVTKMAGLLDRPDTPKGQKDRYEIISLFRQGADAGKVRAITRSSSKAPDPDTLVDNSYKLLNEYEPLPEHGTWGKKDRRWLETLKKQPTTNALPQPNLFVPPTVSDRNQMPKFNRPKRPYFPSSSSELTNSADDPGLEL